MAGGSGRRMNAGIPKQFLLLGHIPVLMHTIHVFHAFDSNINIVLVLPENQIQIWNDLCKKHNFTIKHRITIGANTRFGSVSNGLKLIHDEGLLAIHDGVRPLVSHSTLKRCFELAEEKGNAIPVMPLVDSVRSINKKTSTAENRDKFVSVQTPQVFDVELIKEAYRQEYDPAFTDDASVLEKKGIAINLAEGNPENIKITRPVDLIVAKALLNNKTK
jgi:2-C-methyl-D-erythritol 4-phosphate cytidylyltransferase